MAKKRRSRFDRWLDKQGEDSILDRILYSEIIGDLLKEEHPILYWFIVILLILIFLLPTIIYSMVLAWHEIDMLSDWHIIPFLLGFFSLSFTGIGVANLFMPLIELLCLRLLRKYFPNGFETSFYLGHRVTLIFLVGCGGLAALCAWLTCCVGY